MKYTELSIEKLKSECCFRDEKICDLKNKINVLKC